MSTAIRGGFRRNSRRAPFSLSDTQMKMVMDAAATLPVERRHSFMLDLSIRLKVSRSSNGFVTTQRLETAIERVLASQGQDA